MSPARAGADREDRPLGSAAAGDDDGVAREDRRRRGDLRAAAQPPAFRAGVRVVAADVVRRVRDELGRPSALRGIHGRRPPRRQFLAHRLPDGIAGADVGGEHEGLVLRVALDDHQVLVDDRRARRAPLVLGQVVGAGVEDAEILLPHQLAAHVEGVEALRAEERDDVTAVGRGRRVGVGRLDVTLLARHALVRRGLPVGPAGAAIDAPSRSSAAPSGPRMPSLRRRGQA